MALLIITSEMIEKRIKNDDGATTCERVEPFEASYLLRGCVKSIENRVGKESLEYIDLDSLDFSTCDQCRTQTRSIPLLPCDGEKYCPYSDAGFERAQISLYEAEAIVVIYTLASNRFDSAKIKYHTSGNLYKFLFRVSRMPKKNENNIKPNVSEKRGWGIPMIFIGCIDSNSRFDFHDYIWRMETVERINKDPYNRRPLFQIIDRFFLNTENNIYYRNTIGKAVEFLWENRDNYHYDRFWHTPRACYPHEWYDWLNFKDFDWDDIDWSEKSSGGTEKPDNDLDAGEAAVRPFPAVSPNDVWIWYVAQKNEERLAKAYAMSSNRFWWNENAEYDSESDSVQYKKDRNLDYSWLTVMQKLDDEITTIMIRHGIAKPKGDRKRAYLITFMERNGFCCANGWWQKRNDA